MLPISNLNSRGSPTRRTATGERYKCPKIFLKDAGLGLTLGCGSRETAGQGARAVAEFVKIEKGLGPEGRISVVRFDRGDGINALSPEALRQLTDAARHFEDDSETSVVVLTGSAKAFSAGFDLKDAEGRSRGTMDIGSLRRHLKLGPRLTRAWQEMEQITIGAIEGFCIGGGVALAVALDFRVMARDAHLRVPEIGLGMNMSWQSVPRMLHLIGPARTKQAVILADQRISATEAYEWGLVEEVADPGQAFDAALRLAAKVAAQPPLSVAMTKLTVNRLAHALDDLAGHMDVDQFALASFTEDHKEGVDAFLKRRRPRFKGR
jgi:enoyl-CoA hydratase